VKILLDTQALILAGRDQLPKRATEAFTSTSNEVYFSLVSLWEIGIKSALGKLRFKRKITEYHDLLINELELIPLSIDPQHIEKAVGLPFHHKDPFDRLIVGQALTENLTIVSSDAHFASYGCKQLWD
jgi:PIN domain nuclease of toxin-antitoxin system